jgi:hypothetical protein
MRRWLEIDRQKHGHLALRQVALAVADEVENDIVP